MVTGLTISLMSGTYHDYYTVALAPAIAALVAIGGNVLWANRGWWPARAGLAATMIVTGMTGYVLLGRASAPYDTLQWPVLIISGLATAGFLVGHRVPRILAAVVVGLALVGANAGPAAYAVQTAVTPHTGSIVTAGPVSGGTGGMGPGGQPGAMRARPGGGAAGQMRPGAGSATTSAAILELLRRDAASYDWVAATSGAQSAASFQLATGWPVMAIGGFAGGDPSPTLEEFQTYVAEGRIHYFIGGEGGGSGAAAEIAAWVASNYAATTVDGVTLYDLSPA